MATRIHCPQHPDAPLQATEYVARIWTNVTVDDTTTPPTVTIHVASEDFILEDAKDWRLECSTCLTEIPGVDEDAVTYE